MSVVVLPKGSYLFHGTCEQFDTDELGPGGDGVAWFAGNPVIAQIYLCREGARIYFSAEDVLHPMESSPEIDFVREYIGAEKNEGGYWDVEWLRPLHAEELRLLAKVDRLEKDKAKAESEIQVLSAKIDNPLVEEANRIDNRISQIEEELMRGATEALEEQDHLFQLLDEVESKLPQETLMANGRLRVLQANLEAIEEMLEEESRALERWKTQKGALLRLKSKLKDAGFTNHRGDTFVRSSIGRFLAPDEHLMGKLVVARTTRDLRLWRKASGESSLLDLQYNDIRGFRDAEANGLDGVLVDDFAQSHEWGNYGHLSVGLFRKTMRSLQIRSVPAHYREPVDGQKTPEWSGPTTDLHKLLARRASLVVANDWLSRSACGGECEHPCQCGGECECGGSCHTEKTDADMVRQAMRPLYAASRQQIENLKPNDMLVVYHGTGLQKGFGLFNGIDANREVSRLYGGPRHRGLFVAPDVKTADKFAHYGEIIIELVVRAKNLHGVDYSGNIGREQDMSESTRQWIEDKYPNSFRPYLSMTLLQDNEPQALLRGLVKPSQILRVRYKPYGEEAKWYTRSEFLALGLETQTDAYSRKEKVEDAGLDLSYPGYRVDEILHHVSSLTGRPVERIEKTLATYAKMPNKLEDLLSKVGFGPTAAKKLAQRLVGYYQGRSRVAGALKPPPKMFEEAVKHVEDVFAYVSFLLQNVKEENIYVPETVFLQAKSLFDSGDSEGAYSLLEPHTNEQGLLAKSVYLRKRGEKGWEKALDFVLDDLQDMFEMEEQFEGVDEKLLKSFRHPGYGGNWKQALPPRGAELSLRALADTGVGATVSPDFSGWYPDLVEKAKRQKYPPHHLRWPLQLNMRLGTKINRNPAIKVKTIEGQWWADRNTIDLHLPVGVFRSNAVFLHALGRIRQTLYHEMVHYAQTLVQELSNDSGAGLPGKDLDEREVSRILRRHGIKADPHLLYRLRGVEFQTWMQDMAYRFVRDGGSDIRSYIRNDDMFQGLKVVYPDRYRKAVKLFTKLVRQKGRTAADRSDKEKDEIYSDWKKLINMSKSELEKWAKNPARLKASLNRDEAGDIQSGYDSLHRIKRRVSESKDKWSDEDYDNAAQENGFNSRMLGNDPGKPVGDTGMSKWEISLRNWGHDPSKKGSPAYSKWRSWKDKQKMDKQSRMTPPGGIKTLPQKKWVEVEWREIADQMKEVVWDVYSLSYADIGRHVPDISTFGQKYKLLFLVDVDEDIHPDAFIAMKDTSFGRKLALLGTDGTKLAKRAVIKKMVELSKTSGYYIEASHKIADILHSSGAPVVMDEDKVRTLLKGKDLTWLGGGKYTRTLGTSSINATKSMFGKPRVASASRVALAWLVSR